MQRPDGDITERKAKEATAERVRSNLLSMET